MATSEPVCSTCNDTHRMKLHGRTVPCTRCPTPCQKCRAGGNGPFCERTPCACECHAPRASPPTEWGDRRDEWTQAIDDAFPTRTGQHDIFAKAMRMVGNRHSKAHLVALVNWLLAEADAAARSRDEWKKRALADEQRIERQDFELDCLRSAPARKDV